MICIFFIHIILIYLYFIYIIFISYLILLNLLSNVKKTINSQNIYNKKIRLCTTTTKQGTFIDKKKDDLRKCLIYYKFKLFKIF